MSQKVRTNIALVTFSISLKCLQYIYSCLNGEDFLLCSWKQYQNLLF